MEDRGRRLRRVEEAEGNGAVPRHGENFQERMDVLPGADGEKEPTFILAAVKNGGVIEIKVHDADIRMVLGEVLPERIDGRVPAPPDDHERFSCQIFHGEAVFCSQRMMERNGAAERLWPEGKRRAFPARKEIGIEKAGNNINRLAQMCQNVPRVFRRIFEGDELEFQAGAAGGNPGPKRNQKLARRHGRGTHADDGVGMGGVPCLADSFPA